MEIVRTPEELMNQIAKMDRDNSMRQVYILGKGTFTIVLQEEFYHTIADDIQANPELKQMIEESREEYKKGLGMTTAELLKSLSPKDFM